MPSASVWYRASGWRGLSAAGGLLRALVERDMIVRYRTPVLGVAWAVAAPLVQMLIFALVFNRIVVLQVGMPYPVYAYVGLAAWTLTATALREATSSLSSNAVLVTKLRFAREVLPLAAVCTASLDFAVAMMLACALMLFHGIAFSWTIVLLPMVVIVHITFTTALALILAPANLLWRDVRHMLDVLLGVLMFATSVVYPVQRVGGKMGWWLARNPLTPVIEAYRDVLVRGHVPNREFYAVAIGSVVLLIGAWSVFRRAERRFAEIA